MPPDLQQATISFLQNISKKEATAVDTPQDSATDFDDEPSPLGAPPLGAPKEGGPLEGGPKEGSPLEGGPKEGGPKERGPKGGGPQGAPGAPIEGAPLVDMGVLESNVYYQGELLRSAALGSFGDLKEA
ncbi:hypothetical protein EPH_0007500 [Eimeria praecox]|uniref:Uncharacterized protein n=1 Tax=Eimeria praecox TaxID=51316 RepID=U6GCS8_9EIME|nr:hypothetical protein EPH_0007500 [Eimeria praecox]